jgi:hypothetical protein
MRLIDYPSDALRWCFTPLSANASRWIASGGMRKAAFF